MNVKELRECTAIHHSEETCDVSVVYRCGECGERFRWWEKDKAEECCVYDRLHDFGDVIPRCLCGAAASDEDLRDSQALGSLIRCRACILSVAPELLTAETIATGRAA